MVSQELNALGVSFWGEIHNDGLIGLYFVDGSVSGEKYAAMLEQICLSEVKNSSIYPANLVRMQDGAPPYYTLMILKF